MRLITVEEERRLLANGRWNTGRSQSREDFRPVVKLFCPWGAAIWVLTELDPSDPDLAYGLCDLGVGEPELGHVRLSEIAAVRGPGGLGIQRDRYFRPAKSIAEYARAAKAAGRILA